MSLTTAGRARFADKVLSEARSVALPNLISVARDLPGYASLDEQALRSSLEPGLELVMRPIVEDGRVPVEALQGWFVSLAETRAEQVPLEAGLRYLHRAGQELMAALVRAAQSVELEALDLEEPASLLMETIGRAMTTASAVFSRQEAQRLIRSSRDREAFVVGVLTGTLDPRVLHIGAEAFGLSPQRCYRAARSRGDLDGPGRPGPLGTLTAVLGSTDVVAIVDESVTITTDASTIGVGPSVTLATMASSFAIASRALETASRLRMIGVFTIEDLGVLPAIVSEDAIGERLAERFVRPLDEMEEFGRLVLESVALYLDHLDPQPVARKLHVHPNTVRYRLRRFQEITGADLACAEGIAEVWWAMQRRRLDDQ